MTTAKQQESHNDLVLSYLRLRQALGWLGIALPLAMILGAWFFAKPLAPTISDFYYSEMTDVFVGALCAVGVFLLAYTGYDRRPGEWLSDKWTSRIAGAAAIGVALVPTRPSAVPPPPCSLVHCVTGPDRGAMLHYGLAAVFFAALAVICLVLFTRTDPAKPETTEKHRRNAVFRTCGTVILAAIIGIALYAVLPGTAQAWLDRFSAVFWLESTGIWAFGVSWLVKGKMIGFLND